MFITNDNSHYFVVEDSVDVSKLHNCVIHNSLEEMLNYVCEVYGLYIDEVEGGEMFIANNICYDNRMCGENILDECDSIEEYISNFSL